MAHAGTILGGSAQTKQGGSPWPAVALTFAVVVATVAGVWLASSAGLVGGTAKPAADRSYDQIEAQRGAVVLSTDAYLNAILDKAHAAPYAGRGPLSTDAYLNGILDRAHATAFTSGAATVSIADSQAAYLNAILDKAHAAPYAGRGPLSTDAYLNGILDRAHATPFASGK